MFDIIPKKKVKEIDNVTNKLLSQQTNKTEERLKKNEHKEICENGQLAKLEAQMNYTLQQVVEWGEEPCTKHSRLYDDFKKRNCPQCWKELKKEAGNV